MKQHKLISYKSYREYISKKIGREVSLQTIQQACYRGKLRSIGQRPYKKIILDEKAENYNPVSRFQNREEFINNTELYDHREFRTDIRYNYNGGKLEIVK